MPRNEIDEKLFLPDFGTEKSKSYIQVIRLEETGEAKHGSLTTIFSVWNAMVGTGMLTIPWAYSNSGFVLGLGNLPMQANFA